MTTGLVCFVRLAREARRFPDPNLRATALRKIKFSFRKHSGENDPAALSGLFATADSELASLRRQVKLTSLYHA
eukprot:CAMPEP_0182926282 /NCGR_PEP_ID=MMETSP0105_2-20130417/11408_1 /TAXON_ID=81532 ORGANISM="Acanthoeca-like sp., Strain 10tr" /NCGR_SAMPLE_ID=MMETSP0105_2 /ASSEMBLY_ACC=CAM_ASM_000205 /LENGTH=73 /DNA_ID=CAMNT_0025064165 /DNA_START=42 /DNA_END=263 /DNA_ORIENTATION=+